MLVLHHDHAVNGMVPARSRHVDRCDGPASTEISVNLGRSSSVKGLI